MKIKTKPELAAIVVLGLVAALMAASPVIRSVETSSRIPSRNVLKQPLLVPESTSPSAPKTTAPSAVRPVPAQSPGSIQADSIMLGPSGFEPSVINRSPGQIVMSVDNRAGLMYMHLILSRQPDSQGSGGATVFDQQVPNTSNDFAVLVDLEPGVYVLTEANNPQWTCTWNVAAQ